MWFSIKETCINNFNTFQSLDIFQTQWQQLWRFKFTCLPGWSEIAIAFTTVTEINLLSNALSNINWRFQTINTSIWFISGNHYTAQTATTIQNISIIMPWQMFMRNYSEHVWLFILTSYGQQTWLGLKQCQSVHLLTWKHLRFG